MVFVWIIVHFLRMYNHIIYPNPKVFYFSSLIILVPIYQFWQGWQAIIVKILRHHLRAQIIRVLENLFIFISIWYEFIWNKWIMNHLWIIWWIIKWMINAARFPNRGREWLWEDRRLCEHESIVSGVVGGGALRVVYCVKWVVHFVFFVVLNFILFYFIKAILYWCKLIN